MDLAPAGRRPLQADHGFSVLLARNNYSPTAKPIGASGVTSRECRFESNEGNEAPPGGSGAGARAPIVRAHRATRLRQRQKRKRKRLRRKRWRLQRKRWRLPGRGFGEAVRRPRTGPSTAARADSSSTSRCRRRCSVRTADRPRPGSTVRPATGPAHAHNSGVSPAATAVVAACLEGAPGAGAPPPQPAVGRAGRPALGRQVPQRPPSGGGWTGPVQAAARVNAPPY